MPYVGSKPATGANNSFKLLDDITSYTLTFDGSSSSVVSTGDDSITYKQHLFLTGQRVTYNDGGGTAIGGLSDGVYYIIKSDQNTIKLATSASNATAGTAINLTSVGSGTSHTLNVAFDGVNTKFVATYQSGVHKVKMTRAAQLNISINGVIQQPQDTATPTAGFGFDLDSVIVLSQAPVATDVFWGYLLADNQPTFDITDNKVDNFTGDGTTTQFSLSKESLNNNNVLVTIDGVIQYPSDGQITRAYSVSGTALNFTSAPGNATEIEVRHIGFAGATTGASAVTGFYGRVGNVSLNSSDNITIGNVTGAAATFTGKLNVGGDLNVTGDLVYDEVTGRNWNITGVGTITRLNSTNIVGTISTITRLNSTNIVGTISTITRFNATDVVGTSATITTINATGNINANGNIVGDNATNISGINSVTATTFYGSGGGLTGVSTNLISSVGIQSAGLTIGAGITNLNFIGAGNTFAVSGTTVDISIAGGGGGGSGVGFATAVAGLHTTSTIGVNTTTIDDTRLTGAGNSFQGVYIGNGMMIVDNHLEGNHYIGTAYNGLMAGPVTINGVLTVDGNYVVV